MRNNQNRVAARAAPSSPATTQNTVSYEVPTEFVELPSKGRLYSEDHPLSGQETIEIKFMTAKDEDILSSAALIKKGLVIDRLLENLIVVDVDPTTLLVGDRNAIMVAARISGYGKNYHATVNCPNCQTRVEHPFDLSQSNISENCFDESFLTENGVRLDEGQKTFVVVLPNSNAEVGVKILTGIDEKNLVNLDEDHPVTSTLATFIVSVNGDNNPSAVTSFVENMPARDSKFLRDLYVMLVPDIDLKQEFMCQACFHNGKMEVPLTAEFFWPG